MSTEAQQTTGDDKEFFGMRPAFEKEEGTAADGDGADKLAIEVVDDLPPAQKPRATPEAVTSTDADPDDAELAEYSEGVKKRFKTLTFQREEAKRQRQEALQQRDEAIRAAKVLSDQNRQFRQMVDTGEDQLLDRSKAAAEAANAAAKRALADAHEKGDTEALVAAQSDLTASELELQRTRDFETNLERRREQMKEQAKTPPTPPQQQASPKPDQRALDWAQANPWFQSDDHKEMTALAYGVHEKLIVDEGVKPNSDEYFQRIDDTMRKRFPDYFDEDPGSDGDGSGRQPASSSPKPTQVVAPSSRNNGPKPRTVKLTSSQVAVAKQLGLTNEQYAMQVAKDMQK